VIQATALTLWKLHEGNMDFRQYSRALLMENKFRAVRYGLEGHLIDFGKQIEVPEKDLILEYLRFVEGAVEELGSRKAINTIFTMLQNGSGADRQLKVFRETGSLQAVVDYMAEETRAGL
jgi:carboxylate-amine ligase